MHAAIAGALVAATVVAALFPVTLPAVPSTPVLRAEAITLPGLAATVPEFTVSALEAAPVPLTVIAPDVSAEELLTASDGTIAAVRALTTAQETAAQPTDMVTVARAPEQLPLFYRYEVQSGDTLIRIGERFGVSAQHLVWNNIHLILDEDLLTVGDRLQVPSVEGIIHSVRVGETLTEIASGYDAEVADVIAFPANGLSDPNLLQEGSMILVPGGRIVPKPAPALRPVLPSAQFVDRSPSATGFIWPVVDVITSFYGAYHPLGIDINAPFVSVAAASAGQVVFVGGDPCCSYGLYVDIRHDQGYETRYAHLSSFEVTIGQWVEQGQVLGVSGNSGRSTGPHLHFELRRNGLVQNPLLFLP